MISRLKNPESSGPREEITNRVVEHGRREKRRRTENAIRRNCETLVRGVREWGEKKDTERVKGKRRRDDEREGEQDE